ncbi:MAG: hypothetical protein O6941_05320 [Planctomycetota bacterium]|nr:hypothetical protein [Planctomycetota bacterium]MCZ6612035.1 hypothetical protein [Planctomycetota bacterium]MCZ6850611.1 hypothetical protein [Planctomycetota bacterium]
MSSTSFDLKRPAPIAQMLLKLEFRSAGHRILRYWRKNFYLWSKKAGCYEKVEDDAIRARVPPGESNRGDRPNAR